MSTPATSKTIDFGAHPQVPLMERFKTLYNTMSGQNLPALDGVYHSDIEFTDPLNSVQGLPSLREYMRECYHNVEACRFEFEPPVSAGSEVSVRWVMHLKHKKIKGGEEITVDGCSHLRVEDDRIILHRDYFDLGQMLYEHLPILGSAIRWIRRQAA